MAQSEEELSRLVVEIQLLERTTETLQARLNLVTASINELRMANATLEGVQTEKAGSTILVHIGGGSYLKAKIEDAEKLIVGIGADVAAEKTVDAAKDNVETNILEFEKVRENLQQQLEQTLTRMQALRQKIQEMTQQTTQGQR